MADRPILFSGPMVRALLAGTKTQTRRIMKPQPVDLGGDCWQVEGAGGGDWGVPTEQMGDIAPDYLRIAVGDRLWVKENFAIVPRSAYRNSDGVQQTLRPNEDHDAAVYAADWERSKPGRWRPSIHMFRWASRLTLHVTEVRVQRLQDISEDAKAEGVSTLGDAEAWIEGFRHETYTTMGAVQAYEYLWNHINGKGAWDANPWVAAYTFEVEHCNIAQARAA